MSAAKDESHISPDIRHRFDSDKLDEILNRMKKIENMLNAKRVKPKE